MKRWMVALSAFWVALLVVGVDSLAGKGGGKKPPPDEPPPDPAIVVVVGVEGELTVMNEDCSNRTVLLSAADGVGVAPHRPCWSPDGTQLAFSFDDGTSGKGMYTLDVVVDGDTVYGDNLTMIASIPSSQQFATNAAWSPVPIFGKYRIAFSRVEDDTGNANLFLVNADGSGELTNLHAAKGDVSWSPSGDRLALTPNSKSIRVQRLEQDETTGEIYIGHADRYDLYDNGELVDVRHIDWAKTQDYVLAAEVGVGYEPSDLWLVDLRDGVLDPDAPPEHVDVYILETHITLSNPSRGSACDMTWSSDDLLLLFCIHGHPSEVGAYVLDDFSGNGDPSPFDLSGLWPDWRR
jgi:WD40 repeat protein